MQRDCVVPATLGGGQVTWAAVGTNLPMIRKKEFLMSTRTRTAAIILLSVLLSGCDLIAETQWITQAGL